ncbi:MAG TPA: lytic transglycosylase domain-containing protein [Longimicrobiales bacterium]
MADPKHPDRRRDDEAADVRAAGTMERRREDAGAGDTEEGTTWRSRLRRFRQPLIGLGLAGMAVPMVQATSQEAEPAPDNGEADPEAARAAAADTEEDLAGRIAETREQQERDQQIEDAITRYGISRELAEDIYDIAREQDIEPRLAYGLVKTESTFDERAVSHVGARGLTQVMPRTAAWLIPGTKTEDLYDRQTNLRLGFRYLSQMIDKYRGDVRLALLAYNRGPGTVDKVLKRGGNPDNGYADKVLRS